MSNAPFSQEPLDDEAVSGGTLGGRSQR